MIEPVVTYLERGDNEAQTASLGKMQHLQPRLWAREYASQGSPRGALAVLHDHGEHGGRYSKLGVRFAENGWGVTVFDFRGHGDSDGDRDGVFRSPSDPVEDLDLALTHVAILMPDAPRVAVGTGLGGLTAIAYAIQHPDRVHGFVAINPDVKTGPAYRKPGGVLSSLFGGGVLGIDPKDRFRDVKKAEAFAQEKKITTKRDGKTEGAIEALRQAVRDGAGSLKVPGMVVLSTGARIADAGAVRDFCQRAGARVRLLETDLGHAVVHDDEAEKALGPAFAFLEERFSRGADAIPSL
jgi:alpha-beta hydrolase superfamily lysophospholipase